MTPQEWPGWSQQPRCICPSPPPALATAHSQGGGRASKARVYSAVVTRLWRRPSQGAIVAAGGVVVVGGGVVVVVGGVVDVGVGGGACATVSTIWVSIATTSPVCVSDTTVPTGWVLSANFVVNFSRASVSACCASPLARPTTLGTLTLPLETRRVTADPFGTVEFACGLVSITLPWSTLGSSTDSTFPMVRPTVLIAACAESRLKPVTSGTTTSPGPLETVMVTMEFLG